MQSFVYLEISIHKFSNTSLSIPQLFQLENYSYPYFIHVKLPKNYSCSNTSLSLNHRIIFTHIYIYESSRNISKQASFLAFRCHAHVYPPRSTVRPATPPREALHDARARRGPRARVIFGGGKGFGRMKYGSSN